MSGRWRFVVRRPQDAFANGQPTVTSAKVVGPGAVVAHPLRSQMFDWEIELALVIGKRSRRLTLDNALEAVAAYTVAIDLSARDFNQAPNTFYKLDRVAGKAQDSCCSLGPRLVPAAFVRDPHDLALGLSVNGERKQDARTSDMDVRHPRAARDLVQHHDARAR